METTHESSNQTLCSAQPAKPYAFSRKVFCEGMRDGVPIALGYFAVSFSLGIAARTAGFTPLQGFVASLLNNASAGEYAAFALIVSGATYLEVAIITLIANARYLLMSCALATDLLLNKEEAALRYIEYAGGVKERREEKEAELSRKLALLEQQGTKAASTDNTEVPSAVTASKDTPQINEMQEKLKTAVLKGNRNGIVKITNEALESGEKPVELLNQVLLPAINLVGEYFDQGKYFLPQLIASAEAMKNSIEVLEPLLQTGNSGEEMPVVVIATVEGDIHDIGKNLVALMLKNHGFHVIDLGKDVPQAKILETAKEHHAEFIALSALMTTTMQRMREIVAAAKQEGITAKIIIGGAVITQEYADEIGADGYSKDAADAVKLAKSLME